MNEIRTDRQQDIKIYKLTYFYERKRGKVTWQQLHYQI